MLNWKSRTVGAAVVGIQWDGKKGLKSGRCWKAKGQPKRQSSFSFRTTRTRAQEEQFARKAPRGSRGEVGRGNTRWGVDYKELKVKKSLQWRHSVTIVRRSSSSRCNDLLPSIFPALGIHLFTRVCTPFVTTCVSGNR